MEMKIVIPQGTPVFGVDVGNGFGKVSLLSDYKKDPQFMLPESLRSGMPSTAYAAPDGTISVYGVKQKKAARAVSAVKTRLREDYITLEESRGKPYRVCPCDVYAAIARDLVYLANERRSAAGEDPVYRMVLTYPASFRHEPDLLGKLKRSVESVKMGGHALQVCGMLSEPAAVAVDYLYYMKNLDENPIAAEKYTVLVYDLGHGTFDTAVVTAYANREADCDLICQDGDPEVGGRKFDELLYTELCAQVRKKAGAKAAFDREQLRGLAVEMKHELSQKHLSEMDFTAADKDILLSITREEFEALIMPQILRTLEKVQGMLDEAAQRNVSVDAIVLSGGSSQMPLVRKALTELTGNRIPVSIYRPSVGVAYGAARAAHGLYGEEAPIKQHCERSCGVALEGNTLFLLNEDAVLPCVSNELKFISSDTGRSRIHLRRARDRMPGAEKADYGQCEDILHMFMEIPPRVNCSLTLRMDENRCIFVDCKLPDGSVITQSTFQYEEQER